MLEQTQHIYQFKIVLAGIKPAIWRRIQVPEFYTFWDLHVAIQDAMGWLGYHLHEFEVFNPKTSQRVLIGIPMGNDGWRAVNVLPGWNEIISSYFSPSNKNAIYEYDFGDSWEHKISLEKIMLPEIGVKYPRCIAGERSCPPEDCGGVWGYEELLEILTDPDHEEYEEHKEWAGEYFNPENFNPNNVVFNDPNEWLMRMKESL
jgi:hypothetical protein